VKQKTSEGFTLVELIVTVTLVALLAGLAVPLARNAMIREREMELRQALREIRLAIDEYKEAADTGLIEVTLGSEGYPETLQILVDGVDKTSAEGGKIKFLRRIPVDPMTNSTDWGTKSYQDSPGLAVGAGQDVFDVYTKSPGTALDGSRYADW
jgi:general secretion pathway protein G